MVSSPISLRELAATRPAKPSALPARLLAYWHLLSLDAPTVAVLWAWAFAAASGVRLRPLSALLLGLATWLLYVGDRLLDGHFLVAAFSGKALRERHYFHARHRYKFLGVALPALALLAWLVVNRMDRAPRHEDFILSLAAAVYLLLVHLPVFSSSRPSPQAGPHLSQRLLSKEAAVAVIFCLACVIPAWSREAAAHRWLVGMGVPFALLCWLNCIAIEVWESDSNRSTHHFITGAVRTCLRPASILLSAATLLLAIIACAGGHAAVAAVLLCIATSALLLLRLDHLRLRMTPLQLRAWADAVLLTPAALLLLRFVDRGL